MPSKQELDASLDGIAFNLVDNNWQGATLMYFFALAHRSSAAELQAFSTEQKYSFEDVNNVVGNFITLGILQKEEDGTVALTERGTRLTDVLLQAVPNKSQNT